MSPFFVSLLSCQQHGVIMCFLTTDRRFRPPSLLLFLFLTALTPASLILEFFLRFDIYNLKELERNPDLARILLGGNIGAISVKIHFLRFYIPCMNCQVWSKNAKFARNLALPSLPKLGILGPNLAFLAQTWQFESRDRQHTKIPIINNRA
jgi:hypothetical protein